MSKSDDVWREEASLLGLRFHSGGFFGNRRIDGELAGFPVLVEEITSGKEPFISLEVGGRDRIPPEFELKAETFGTHVAKVFNGEDVQTGDERFDDAVNAFATEPVALAFLGQQARSSMLDLVSSGGRVSGGSIYLEAEGSKFEHGMVQWLVDLVSSLPAGTVVERLLANALGDSNPAVRLRNLSALANRFRSAEETNRAAEAALSDPEPAIRVLATSLVKGDRSKAVLKALLEDAGVPDDVRRDAVQSAAASKDASLLGPICALLPTTCPALAEALATALGQLGDARVEDALLGLMSRDSVAVKRAAAAALGNVGTLRAVEPLLLITSVTETALTAVRRIQSRLKDAAAGRLSIAVQEPPVGGLSVALGEGALSVASGCPPDAPTLDLEGVPAPRDPVED